MQIDNEFQVGVPVERAWAVLTDLAAIAPCMPGAQLTGVEGDVYSGRVKVKVGPVTSEYAGTARFADKDDTGYRAVIDARGRDARGAGNASATITAHLRPEGGRTLVSVSTDLKISGRIAQFGSGMIKEVSSKLLGQFVECLEGKLATASAGETAAAPQAGDLTGAGAAGAPVEAGVAGDPGGAARPASPTGDDAPPAVPAGAASDASADRPAPAGTAAASRASADGPALAGTAALGSATAPASAPRRDAGRGGTVSAPDAMAAQPAQPAVLDLMSVAGGSIYKRALPLIAVLLIAIGLIIYFAVR